MKALLLIFLVALCALAQTINVEFDQAANFEKCYTFAIRDGQLNSRNPALNNELVKKRIEADIERESFLARIHQSNRSSRSQRALPLRRRTQSGTGNLSRRMARLGHTRRPRAYTEGTLVIDLRDPPARWSGVESLAKTRSDSSTLEGKLDDMVRKSIEKYPPKPK